MEKIKTETPVAYTITEISPVTHDTKAFRFALPENTSLDFIPGDHLHMHLDLGGEDVTRPYTPASTPDDVGFFELIVKRYPTGIMSGYLHRQNVGDSVMLSGPISGGHYQPGMPTRIGMVAGGAGITPMIAIIRTALRRRYAVQISLIYANKTKQDIILRQEFEEYARDYPNFRALFALDQAPPDWPGHSGHIDDAVLTKHLPPAGPDSLIFLCGPPMMEYVLREKLLKLGHGKKQVVIP